MPRGPTPSQLCLLSALAKQSVGDKTRSVTAYSTASAMLTLGHRYPAGSNALVSVNIELVLQTLQSGLTRVGEWVNVIGYVTAKPKANGSADGPVACVQALLVWSTGPLDLQRYEGTFDQGAAPPT
ncbi:Telomere length regulation/capping, TEN1 [Drechmeria coniospora]|uniref:Telomere length regulation/capping, TEN1 n=1 Tax=Drechmeria coniospora TaxID=98403 RepID=A0A151GTC6_DRECN|nr:Telomere length regulation/capping, TEN1 [Drechmeria coniospora]KYK60313.1 Telomere length regulation/capping, TEN1 [Drechmeria coniospora]